MALEFKWSGGSSAGIAPGHFPAENGNNNKGIAPQVQQGHQGPPGNPKAKATSAPKDR